MAKIADNASVDPRAEIADDVVIGPFCVVGPEVSIGGGTRLENHVTLTGRLRLGQHNHLYAGAVLGAEPQDLSYRGERTEVIVGDHNTLREGVTIHRATAKEEGLTSLGNHCYLMAGAHVAHDCRVGDHVTIANNTLLGGHVHIENQVTLSATVAIHHFTTIGRCSFVGGLSRVVHDVPPFLLADGIPARPRCVNTVGLQRNGFPATEIHALGKAFRLLFREQTGAEVAQQRLRERQLLTPAVHELIRFIQGRQQGSQGRRRDARRVA
ncbi:MAG: acyl-[acyl-carrier-protein]--UDP-N-acetylglucosamine O-acyltransferase [Planctomycetaceae bacterium]|nr:acyl-[acyl-carrier-protein]--UDP-N-acetylglucosamine O-acyltransferase [Planctomycetaceae bacterium]